MRSSLRERVAASYYQPLPAESRRPDGDYALMDDGRFSASMDFSHRPTGCGRAGDRGSGAGRRRRSARWSVAARPGRVRQVLELAFREGGEFEGVRPLASGGFEPVGGAFAYRLGGDRIAISVGEVGAAGRGYHPGEDYTHLSGTDAAEGLRVYVPLPSSGDLRLGVTRSA